MILVCGSTTQLQSAWIVPRHPAWNVLMQTDDIVSNGSPTEPHKTMNLIGGADLETKVAVQVPHQTQPWFDLTPNNSWHAIPSRWWISPVIKVGSGHTSRQTAHVMGDLSSFVPLRTRGFHSQEEMISWILLEPCHWVTVDTCSSSASPVCLVHLIGLKQPMRFRDL